MSKRQALEALLDELGSFEINLNHYWDYLKPQGAYDSILTGKLDALAHWCQSLGRSDLAQSLFDLLPLQATAPQAMSRVQEFVIPQLRSLLEGRDVDATPSPDDALWDMLHPRIKSLAKPRFEAGFYGDAVESAFKEVNDTVKRIFLEAEGRELDGAGLMTTALSPNAPIIRLSPLQSESDKNKQQGYMQIFAGAMTGIRNPKAHGNVESDARRTFHLLVLASLLMHQIGDRA